MFGVDVAKFSRIWFKCHEECTINSELSFELQSVVTCPDYKNDFANANSFLIRRDVDSNKPPWHD